MTNELTDEVREQMLVSVRRFLRDTAGECPRCKGRPRGIQSGPVQVDTVEPVHFRPGHWAARVLIPVACANCGQANLAAVYALFGSASSSPIPSPSWEADGVPAANTDGPFACCWLPGGTRV